MVSIRRRKLLGLCGGRNSFLTPLPKFSDNGYNHEIKTQSMKPVSVHPLPSSIDIDLEKEKPFLLDGFGSFYTSGSAASGENHVKPFPEVKRRKRHRRKHSENQEICVMRGVYFKNMKWQAAIKVDKKQIHLGTVGSQEEAARLYDRAAFMCGREPNFELPEDEKQELSKFNWEEFLAFTRSAINNKKHRRGGGGGGLRRKSEALMVKSDWESEQGMNGLSGSEEDGGGGGGGGEPDSQES